MDLFKAMKSFVTTAESGSMSAAANSLRLTPAMVGQHIAGLEVKLGTQLLNRTTRRQSLTDFGHSYFDQCKDILERVAITEIEAEAQSIEPKGTLRITAPLTFGTTLLMSALKQYRERAPHVKLDVILTDKNLDIVEEGIDIAFRIGKIPDSRIIQRVLMPYRMVVSASPAYLSQYNVPSHPNELLCHEFISFTKNAGIPLIFYGEEGSVEVKVNSMVNVNNGNALLHAAKSGLGVIVQPEILLENDLKAGRLKRILPDWHLGERHVSMTYYRHRKMTLKVRSFIEFAIEIFNG